MDAVAYIKAYARMCDSFDSKNNITGKPCVGCPLEDIGRGCHMNDLTNNAEECVAAVEKWAKEHPARTRLSELRNLFPLMDEEMVRTTCPLRFDNSFHGRNNVGFCTADNEKECNECTRRFWLEELEEGEP